MIVVDKVEVHGWESAIRGMRNPLASWCKSDSEFAYGDWCIGPNDLDLMMKLRNAGPDHRKFMRMLTVTMDIEAPLFWWKEFDTYKVATVRNSCSTMHKIHSKPITHSDFWWIEGEDEICDKIVFAAEQLRLKFLNEEDPIIKQQAWRKLIEILPSAYMQKSTVQLNYETLMGMYKNRKNHKLEEWRLLCKVIEKLPHSDLITS